jgi:KUP system potassium uptake protein
VVAAIVCLVLFTWQRGRVIVTENASGWRAARDFVRELPRHEQPVQRVPGHAVFLNRGDQTTPLAMRANVEHNHALHEHVVVLSIETCPCPTSPRTSASKVSDLGFRDDGISHVTARFGFQETPNVPEVLRDADERGLECPLEVDEASYFLSRSSCSHRRAGHEPLAQAPVRRHRRISPAIRSSTSCCRATARCCWDRTSNSEGPGR